MILSQTTDIAGKIRILWQSDATGEVYQFKFSEQPTKEQLEALSDSMDSEIEIKSIPVLSFDILENRQLIISFLEAVKGRPNLTLAQYNAFLSAMEWYDAATIRLFVFVFAVKLADRRGIILANQNENTVLQAVRDFIVDTPARKLAKLIFNEIGSNGTANKNRGSDRGIQPRRIAGGKRSGKKRD